MSVCFWTLLEEARAVAAREAEVAAVVQHEGGARVAVESEVDRGVGIGATARCLNHREVGEEDAVARGPVTSEVRGAANERTVRARCWKSRQGGHGGLEGRLRGCRPRERQTQRDDQRRDQHQTSAIERDREPVAMAIKVTSLCQAGRLPSERQRPSANTPPTLSPQPYRRGCEGG